MIATLAGTPCSSSNSNDQRAVTIECASDKAEPYAFNNTVYNKLIDLCVDICKRNGKKKLLWIPDKNKALAYKPASDEMLLTVHRWFANKSCPGDWLMARMGNLANKVTARLGGSTSQPTKPSKPASKKPSVNYTAVAKAVIRGDYGNGSARRNKLVSKFGKDGADKIQAIVNKLCS